MVHNALVVVRVESRSGFGTEQRSQAGGVQMRNYPIRVSFMIFLCVLASFASAAGKRKQQNKSETVVEVKSISPESVYTFSRSVGAGRLVKASSGKVGLVKRTYRLLKEEGKVVGKAEVDSRGIKFSR